LIVTQHFQPAVDHHCPQFWAIVVDQELYQRSMKLVVK
jgi:hypothetical protein